MTKNETVNTLSPRDEKLLSPMSGFPVLFMTLALFCGSIIGIIFAGISLEQKVSTAAVAVLTGSITYLSIVFPILLAGFKVNDPNEAAVFVLFGRYYGTLVKQGFFFVNPFCVMLNPAASAPAVAGATNQVQIPRRKISMKATTLNNEKQKINDREGNPIDIGVVVIWRVVNPTKAVFEVDNYKAYVSIQTDAALRQVVRQYPYDIAEEGDEKSLRGSSNEVAEELKKELQKRVDIAGAEVIEARITHLAYAQEIAAAMLQRQQASAIISARQKIVEGAVGMVEMALNRLSENDVVTLDDERKAAMVSNLLVVLCGNRDAQPVVNSGSIY